MEKLAYVIRRPDRIERDGVRQREREKEKEKKGERDRNAGSFGGGGIKKKNLLTGVRHVDGRSGAQ